MKINLSEIPAEGRSFHFDRKTGEFNETLADLLASRPYSVDFTIRPVGNAFELRGAVRTSFPEVCSRCGWDIEVPVDQKFNEILLEDQEQYRKSHSVHGNQSVNFLNEGPSVTHYRGDVFEPADFVHEVVAISHPTYPTCANDTCEHLPEVLRKQAELEAEFQKAEETRVGHPGFAALKDFKPGGVKAD